MLDVVSTRVTSPVLVGRADQLTALDEAFGRVRRGSPSAVLIGGEAGVGKSRLMSEFSATAGAAGARVLAGGCLEFDQGGLPFAPFTTVLRNLVRDLGADGVAGLLPGRATRELARLLPEFGQPAGEADSGEARARLFEEVLSLFERLADPGPVTLVIEDLHWADRSTRDLLAFLVGNQRTLDGLLIVGTYRSDELHRTHPRRPLLAELDRISWVERIELPRLSRRDAGDLAFLAINLAEPLVALGRWDEATEAIEHALDLCPPPMYRSSLRQLAGQIALARGDLDVAAESAAASRTVLSGAGYKDQNQLPLASLEIGLLLAQGRGAEALAAAGNALDRFDLQPSPRYAWPVLIACAQACTAAARAAAATRNETLRAQAVALLGRIRAQAEKLDADGPVQEGNRLTFAAEAACGADGGAGAAVAAQAMSAWDAVATAWDQAGQPYPHAIALLRAAEAAMGRQRPRWRRQGGRGGPAAAGRPACGQARRPAAARRGPPPHAPRQDRPARQRRRGWRRPCWHDWRLSRR